jgi:putative endonuclease
MSLASFTLTLERALHTRLRARADRLAADRADLNPDPRIRPKPDHLLTGERGEDAAFFHLRSLGYTIVARRWRSRRLAGDLDLIAWDGPTLVIVEVKTLTASREQAFLPAEIAVDRSKQDMLRKMAAAYLHLLPEPHRASVHVRFDILAVYLSPGDTEYDHIRDAFPRSAPPRRRLR